MKRIVILGNSPAIVKIIENVRAAAPENEIVLWSTEKSLPYFAERLPEYAAEIIPFKDVICQPEKFYQQNNVRLILGKNVGRINFRRGQLANEEKEAVDYDFLVIAGSLERRFPEIKGTNKYGVVDANKLDDVDHFVKSLTFIDTVIMQTQTLSGLKMVEAVRKAKKEVIVVVPASLSSLSEEVQAKLRELETAEVRVIPENSIVEILGDADARAVRLKSGKVYACESILFDETVPYFKLFIDTPLKMNQGIVVDSRLRTSIENVFACGEVAGLPADQFAEQAGVIAANILGQEAQIQAPAPEPAVEEVQQSQNVA